MSCRLKARAFAATWAIAWLAICAAAPTAAGDLHRVRIEGKGSVTVVFENGLGDSLEVWQGVQPKVARCTRTFSYNRAGYPGSPRAAGGRDSQRIVDELRQELAARGVRPPYLLVGHSLGGLYMQYFARRYPQDVAGLVLVDATHWDHLQRIRAESPGTYRMLKVASLLMTDIMRRELRDSDAAGREVRAAPAPATPTIVLSSTRAAPGEGPDFRDLMRRMQEEMAATYEAQRHQFVEDSGHYIQRDQPDEVTRAILDLAGCS